MHAMSLTLHWFLRLFIGGVIFASARGKSLDLSGFVEVLRTYPDLALWPLALAVLCANADGSYILSGKSDTIPSTPSERILAMSAGLFTVYTNTVKRALWRVFTSGTVAVS
jgi:hypothetical protein